MKGRTKDGPIRVSVPMAGFRVYSEANRRDHHHAKARRVKAQREEVALRFARLTILDGPRYVVTLRRVAPTVLLDDDNLRSSLKAVRDEVAEWLGLDDSNDSPVHWVYRQDQGPWWVTVTVTASERSPHCDTCTCL